MWIYTSESNSTNTNTAMYITILEGIFPTQGLNPMSYVSSICMWVLSATWEAHKNYTAKDIVKLKSNTTLVK